MLVAGVAETVMPLKPVLCERQLGLARGLVRRQRYPCSAFVSNGIASPKKRLRTSCPPLRQHTISIVHLHFLAEPIWTKEYIVSPFRMSM